MGKGSVNFATMDPAKQRSIAHKGGKAAHASGRAYEWTGGKDGTAAVAGRKAQHQRRQKKSIGLNFSQSEDQMSKD